jgi:hypothetical protein
VLSYQTLLPLLLLLSAHTLPQAYMNHLLSPLGRLLMLHAQGAAGWTDGAAVAAPAMVYLLHACQPLHQLRTVLLALLQAQPLPVCWACPHLAPRWLLL